MKRLDCEYYLEPGQGRFWGAIDPVDLGDETLSRLRALSIHPRACGELLFDLLFPRGSSLRDQYRKAAALARHPDHPQLLCFRLCLDGRLPEPVQMLAWELLCDEDGETLARSERSTFSRFLPLGEGMASAPARICRPRVLVAIADPPDSEAVFHLPSLEGERFRSAWRKKLSWLRLRIAATTLKGYVTLAALQEKLKERRFEVLHLVAHGLPDWAGRSGLVLQNKKGQSEIVEDETMAQLFSGSRTPCLVTFVACHGAGVGQEGAFRGLPQRLLRKGVPGVVAMRREISFEAAEIFTRAFYAELARTGEIELAVNAARRALFAVREQRRYWNDPVLFRTREPWRKGQCHLAAAAIAVTTVFVLGMGVATGTVQRICCAPPPQPDPLEKVEPPRPEPSPPRPALRVTRVGDQEFDAKEELTVSPSGEIQGTLQGVSGLSTIRAVSIADGKIFEKSAQVGPGDWVIPDVRFRTPESLRETHATVTIEAGAPPDAVSRSVRVRVPAPRIEITHICDEPEPDAIGGTAENVLEQEEQVWVKIQRRGDGNNPRCLYAPIVDGRWRVEDRWSCGAPAGSAMLHVGLVVQPPGSPACPDGEEALDNGIIP